MVIRQLIVAEVVAYGVFMVLALSAHWANLYRDYIPISRYISFTVIEFSGLALFQIALLVFILNRTLQEEQSIRDIIRAGEHSRLEFKTSFRWDVKRDQINKDLERSVMKTIAAFLNSEGGSLVIGVDDGGQPFGIEADMASLARQSRDGFENHFNNMFSSMIGPEFRQHVRVTFHSLDNKSVCLIEVDQAPVPAYVKTEKGEDFFIRTGNATTPLKMSQAAAYVASWRR